MAKTTALQRLKKALKVDEHKLDKFLSHFYEGSVLGKEDELMLEKYRKAFSSMSLGRTFDMTLAMLMKDYQIQERQARYIIAESAYLYGNVQQLDKAGKKVASANYFRLLSNLARANGDIDSAVRAWDKADTLDGLHEVVNAGMNPDDFLKAAKIVFVDNINILKQSNRADDE